LIGKHTLILVSLSVKHRVAVQKLHIASIKIKYITEKKRLEVSEVTQLVDISLISPLQKLILH
jgi:hypothetical protein